MSRLLFGLNRPVLALIVSSVIMGVSAPILKYTIIYVPIFTLLFIRFFVGGMLFAPAAFHSWKPLNRRETLLIVGVAILGITINMSAAFLGLAKTDSINLPVIASAGPVILYFLSVKFLKEKPNRRVFWGMIIALLGVLIIIFSPVFASKSSLDLGMIEGNLLILLSLIVYIISVLFKKEALRSITPGQVMFLMCVIGSLGFVPNMLNEMKVWNFSQLSIVGWGGLLFGTFITTVVGHYLLTYGLSKINAEEVGLFTYIDPVAAVLVAAPLLGEIPGLDFYLGSLLVFGGIFIAENRLHWHPFHKLKT